MSTESIMSLSDQYVMKTYGRLPLAFVRGQGAKVWDADGREYLDFLGGLAVNILGHAHPGVAKAVAEQAATLIHVSNLYYIEAQAKLAEKLCSGSGLGKAFFCNSGAEANEAAIKLARRYQKVHNQPDRVEIITLLNSFHGRTLATITATGQPKYQKGFEPLPAGFAHVPINDVAALQAAVGEKTAAVMVEVIQGEGGVNLASAEYLRQVQALCRKSGALMIIDEVQTGMGRTGRLFAFQNYGLSPDIVTVAKGLGGGVPIGAMLATDAAATGFEPGSHASTFGGNPLACAAGLAVFEALEAGDLIAQAQVRGAYLRARLGELAGRFGAIREIRGLGLMVGVELDVPATPIFKACQANGLLINAINDRVLRFLPPLIVSEAEIDQAVAIVSGALQTAVAV